MSRQAEEQLGVTTYAWIKLAHITAIALWSAGLVYLPALFAEHPKLAGREEFRRLRYRTRLTYVAFASPAAVIAVVTGTVMIPLVATLGGWLIYKLIAVAALVMVHVYLGHLMWLLHDQPRLRRPFWHLLLLVPVLMVIVVVLFLVTVKPH